MERSDISCKSELSPLNSFGTKEGGIERSDISCVLITVNALCSFSQGGIMKCIPPGLISEKSRGDNSFYDLRTVNRELIRRCNMRKMTEQNLQAAFAGESQAHMKYSIFSEIAESEGKSNIARLFKAIAYAEEVHASNHLKVLSGIGKTADNLDSAIIGETFEVEEMYPAYNEVAKLQNEKEAQKSTHYALEAEKIHAQMYSRAKEEVDKDRDIKLGKVYICPVCGYTVEGEAPEYCPVCGAKKGAFKEF